MGTTVSPAFLPREGTACFCAFCGLSNCRDDGASLAGWESLFSLDGRSSSSLRSASAADLVFFIQAGVPVPPCDALVP
jgi:hypothetical protein